MDTAKILQAAKVELMRHSLDTWFMGVLLLFGFATTPRLLHGHHAQLAVKATAQENTQDTSKPKLSSSDYHARGYVNDFANLTDSKTRAELESLCKVIDKKEHAQIAVVSITSLGGSSIESFSLELANRWGVGHKEDNRGVLILLARDDHKCRIEVGYGLESILTDAKASKIVLEMVPMLRKSEYGNALLHAVRSIDRVLSDASQQEGHP